MQQLKMRQTLHIAPDKREYPHRHFSYFSTKAYVVGTHQKHLSEALLISTTQHMFFWKNKKNIRTSRLKKKHLIWSYDYLFKHYSKTCVREPPSILTLNSVWCGKSCLSYKGTCHVILLAKLHDMYLYKTTIFPHQPLRSILKVAVLHRFYCACILFTLCTGTDVCLFVCLIWA